jgi:hypothetical protein
MRRLLLVVIGATLCLQPAAFACGDKFLIIGRGASYRNRYVAIHPAAILLYGEKAAGRGDVDVRRILQRAGHHVDLAADGAQLESAMRAKRYDFVIATIDAVEEATRRARAVSSDALVLPILFASNANEVTEAERQFECIAKADRAAKQRSFLAVLDDAMGIRLKGEPVHCNWAK